ncbi:MAG TPA: Uma2 family endonuclease [Kofleriaceae bacterium]|nr:Uma2 family endonuclease [Kofleriaceae bacterium]
MSSDAFRMGPAPPAVDDRLVEPETRYEMYEGRLVHVSPADRPHGTRHSKVSALLEAHAGLEFDVASDMLTRTADGTDVAPDVSVFPSAPDPWTGGRQLEQLAFEVVSTQTLGNASIKAARLVARGVRRVFAIDVERSRALEWSAPLHSWRMLDPTGHIEDPTLDASLPIEALVRTARADDAVARALLIKRNPVLVQNREEGRAEGREEGRAEGREEGLARGKAEAVIVLLTTRGIAIDEAARARILAERDPHRLDRWIARAATCAMVSEVVES